MKFFYAVLILSIITLASEMEAMQNACERGISEACYQLGSIYSGLDGLKPDIEKTKMYYRKACDLDHDKSCLYLEQLNRTKN